MKLNQVRLLVDDFAACRDFYRDILGLELTLEAENEVYAQLIGEGVALGLYRRELMAGVVGRAEAADERGGKDTHLLAFQVEDVDAVVANLKTKGAELVTEPHDQEAWFMRVAHLRDPDGNLIEIFHSLYTGESA